MLCRVPRCDRSPRGEDCLCEAARRPTFVADGNAALLGVHLNFTQGRALSPAERIPTLLGDGALFLGAAGFREAWARGAIDPAELIEEAAAQLSWFRR